jgi:hypothetical protein
VPAHDGGGGLELLCGGGWRSTRRGFANMKAGKTLYSVIVFDG